MSSLCVYTASAGAGKTHTITYTFLRLALAQEHAYSHLQAVTFTNKATDEMRDRFLLELYTLARDPDSSSHLSDLLLELKVSKNELQQRAEKTLAKILFDYSHLRVMTIDSFFQEIIKSLAMELGLPTTMKVEISTDQYLEWGIDALFLSPSTRTFDYLSRLLENEDFESVGIAQLRRKLRILGRHLEKEEVQELISSKNFPTFDKIESFTQELHALLLKMKKEISTHIANLQKHISSSLGLEQAMKKNKSLSKLFAFKEENLGKKMLTPKQYEDYRIHRYEPDEYWVGQFFRVISDEAFDAVELWKRAVEWIVTNEKDFHTLRAIRKNVHSFALIQELHQNIERIRQEKEVIFLEKSKELVKRIVDEDQLPFIYEKIGVQIRHHMIDEFQDTSRFQYHNFLPLLEEALATNHENMIVGDVKQSIYRFRNSDPMILHEDLSVDFAPYFDPYYLKYNWRSAPAIVEFNNALFPKVAYSVDAFLNEDAEALGLSTFVKDLHICQKVYREVEQKIPESHQTRSGAVFFHQFVVGKDEPKLKQSEVRELIAAHIPILLVDLLKRGYSPRDIAILGHRNKQLREVAEAIIDFRRSNPNDPYAQRLEFVSEDLLTMERSQAFRLVMAMLRAVAADKHTQDEQLFTLSIAQEIESQFASARMHDPESTLADFVSRLAEESSHISLYALVKKVVSRVVQISSENEIPYLIGFLDLTHDYAKDQIADLDGFLEWIENNAQQLKVPYEAQDAVSLLTIHKSKGLGFPVVLLLSVGKTRTPEIPKVWCSTEKIEARNLFSPGLLPKKLPIEQTLDNMETDFALDLHEEWRADELDNLNTLYVACTRAEEELHFWQTEEDLDRKPRGLEGAFWSGVADLMLSYEMYSELEFRGLTISSHAVRSGDNPIRTALDSKHSSQASSNTTYKVGEKHLAISTAEKPIAVRQYSQWEYKNRDEVFRGEQWHLILSGILTTDDLEWALRSALVEGWIGREDRDALFDYFDTLLRMECLGDWYHLQSSWQVFNERKLIVDGKVSRPDRVMVDKRGEKAIVVDYKTGQEEKGYRKQIIRYTDALKQVGYREVEGYLLYLKPNPHDSELVRVV